MNEAVFGRKAVPTQSDEAVFKPRRFTDPVSQLNESIHDTARQLALAVEMVDSLGIRILNVEADRSRNQRVNVFYSRECDALEAVEFARTAEFSHWVATRFGVEIRWCVPTQTVQAAG